VFLVFNLHFDGVVKLLVNERFFVGLQVDLLFDLFESGIEEGEVDGEAEDIFQNHLGLVKLEDRAEARHLLAEVDVQVALLVHLEAVPVRGQQ